MRKVIIFLLLCILGLDVSAQRDLKPGYIITNEDDTIYGQIDYQIEVYNAEHCYFKKNDSSEAIVYKPGDIKAYRFINSKYYVSRKINLEKGEKEVFLEFLINGKADIFYFPPSYFFIEKEGMGLHILENTEKLVVRNDKEYLKEGKEYIGILTTYMREEPALYEKFRNINLDQKQLIKVAKEYHQRVCPDEECTIYSKSEPTNIFTIGYAIGCMYNYIDVYDESVNESKDNWSPGILTGLQLNYAIKGIRERFSTYIGLYYSQVNHKFTLRQYDYTKVELDFSSKNILVDLGFRYTYHKYKLKPFVGIGVFYFQTLSSSKNQSNSILYEPEKKSTGLELGTGLQVQVFKNTALKFDANYQNSFFNISKDKYFSSVINNLNFLLSIQYTLKEK